MAYVNTEKLKLHLRRYLMPNVDDDGTVTEANATRYFLNLIDKMSTKDVEKVKHGEWIETKEWYFDEYAQSEYQRKCYECSICKRTELNKELYCHCGAKMDGGNAK